MDKGNKYFFKLSILAIVLLIGSFFYYENNQKKMTEKFDKLIRSEEGTAESSAVEVNQELLTESSEEEIGKTASSAESEINHTPQTMKEPLIVNDIVIVNKRYPLPESYDPGENQEALEAFNKMNAEMRNLGMNISSEYSGYRSYKDQEALYQNYVESDGKEEADRYSSRPGYSEHQTGLAFDFINSAGELVRSEEEADWIDENAHLYGFIVRYKPGQEEITGYVAEAWHVRYVGEKAAQEIKERNTTLEEYLNVEGGDYVSGE
ncbi:M15 family metallopeptidase [Enterococcus sp. BWB1-3]|uniref:M15 family metallopeptidase n=1 Tax=Enterococcus sp. BWB1-3 TaxID=2787713 RepID=UPI001920AE0B|nr:M15 family metallopeptidase [Enterococcus sp. BWB1-3]MBL1227718.1 M15 family metallopeptidase [Enterococcus sp. BWB1-3]